MSNDYIAPNGIRYPEGVVLGSPYANLIEENARLKAQLATAKEKADALDALEEMVKAHGNQQGSWIEIDCYSHWQIDAAKNWSSGPNLGNGKTLTEAIHAAKGGGA